MQEGCTVVLPTYNEEGNIGKMVSTLREMYPEFYVLVMDDNSKDRTKEIVEDISSKDDHVRFFTRDPNDRGLSASIFFRSCSFRQAWMLPYAAATMQTLMKVTHGLM